MNTLKFTAIIFFAFLLNAGATQGQSVKTYKGKGFSLEYPNEWKTTDEKGILNFFPAGNDAAVTISTYPNVSLSIEQLKTAIVSVTSGDSLGIDSVKTISAVDPVEIYYECVANDTKWVAKIFNKKGELYFITLNSTPELWLQNSTIFMTVINSFKLD